MKNPLFEAAQPAMNNPVLALLAAMASGQNPMQALQQIMPGALNNIPPNKTLEQYVREEYNRRGIDINNALTQIQNLTGANRRG